MKRSLATLSAWLLVLISAVAIFYEVNIGVYSLIIFTSVLIGIGFFAFAIWESISWGNNETGPYGGILYKKKPSYHDEDDADYVHESNINFKFKKLFKWSLIIAGVIFLYNMLSTPVKQSITMFNNAKQYQNYYKQKVDEKAGFYDKMWKTYLTKEKITNVNKETFLVVSKIIMENRKDGEKITWKWISENQQIPYNEFTKFYADLSIFITEQREGYFNIEKECQTISNYNNTMLDTFPNNLYNKFLDCPHIKFEYGILSDSTINVFKNGVENIK